MTAFRTIPAGRYRINQHFVATPMRNGDVTNEVEFLNGLSVRRLDGILWDGAIVNGSISSRERDSLQQVHYWMCSAGTDNEGEQYFQSWLAMMSTQIVCPVGSKNIHLRMWSRQEGFDNIGSVHRDEIYAPLIGRVTDLTDLGLVTHFDQIFEGTQRAYREGIVRLQHPLVFLQHAMHSRERYISLLHSVIGLDMLVMAGSLKPFVERLMRFLGANTYIFPVTSTLGQQARAVVSEVVEHIYALRNILAHGQEIPLVPYREPFMFLDTEGVAINVGSMIYADHLSQCALFLLCACLRKVFVDRLVDDISTAQRWRAHLK